MKETDVQTEIRFCFYDYENEERIELDPSILHDEEVKYIYVENGILYVEVDEEVERV